MDGLLIGIGAVIVVLLVIVLVAVKRFMKRLVALKLRCCSYSDDLDMVAAECRRIRQEMEELKDHLDEMPKISDFAKLRTWVNLVLRGEIKPEPLDKKRIRRFNIEH